LKFFILNPGIPNMLRSDNLIISYSSLYISHWPAEFEPPCFICHLYVSPSDQNCSKDPSLHIATLILNRYLPNAFRSDHLIKSFDSLHIEAGLGF